MNVINFTGDAWEARVGDGDPYEDALRIADAVGELAHELNPDARVYVGFDSRSLSRSLAPEMAEVVAPRAGTVSFEVERPFDGKAAAEVNLAHILYHLGFLPLWLRVSGCGAGERPLLALRSLRFACPPRSLRSRGRVKGALPP